MPLGSSSCSLIGSSARSIPADAAFGAAGVEAGDEGGLVVAVEDGAVVEATAARGAGVFVNTLRTAIELNREFE